MTMINIDSTYGVIVLQDLKVVSVDENYAQIYGYDTAEELLNSIDSFLELIPEEWSIDAGHLTPTMKLKRKVVKEKYIAIIEKMYSS